MVRQKGNPSENTSTPEGLHSTQYGLRICEERLGWPGLKQNVEVIGAAIDAIAKKWRRPTHKAYEWLDKKVVIALAQRMTVDRFFFMEGKYNSVHIVEDAPEIDRKKQKELRAATEAEQATPEFQELSRQAREKLRELAGMKDMGVVKITPERRRELKRQATQIAQRSGK